ncbi:MAG: hypothetical protein JRS35_22155 [Deltaproteobacteria bacterium]|nr:hypothetical protein [Deltaproteobacteria bacterium]
MLTKAPRREVGAAGAGAMLRAVRRRGWTALILGLRLAPLLLLTMACAGDLVLRAPQQRAPRGAGALAALAPLAVELLPAAGAVSAEDPVGEREAGMGARSVSIYLTEDAGVVLWRLVAGELRAAGHRIVDAKPDVVVGIRVLEFSVRDPARSPGWDVIVSVRLALRVAKTPDAEDFTEFVYTAERSGRSFLWPGIRSNERILAECLDDLAQLVSEREALAAALARHAGQ